MLPAGQIADLRETATPLGIKAKSSIELSTRLACEGVGPRAIAPQLMGRVDYLTLDQHKAEQAAQAPAPASVLTPAPH